MTLRMAQFSDDSRVAGSRRMVPLPQRRRSPNAVRQRVLALITAQPGVTHAALMHHFRDVNPWTLRSAMKWLLHIDGTVRYEGVRSPRRRYFPVTTRGAA